MLRRRMTNKVKSTVDANTVLLLHGNTLTDQSGNGATILYSNVTANSGGKFSKGYLYFNGNAYLRLTSFALSTSKPYTVDFWVYFLSDTGNSTVLVDTCTYQRNITALRKDTAQWTLTSTTVVDDDSYIESTTYNTWVHVAFTFDGTKYNVFRKGTLIMSSTNLHPMDFLTFGEDACDSGWTAWKLKGYISELRVSNKVRWTSSFTPPTKAY